jgi:hypothetical protein
MYKARSVATRRWKEVVLPTHRKCGDRRSASLGTQGEGRSCEVRSGGRWMSSPDWR